MNELFNRHYKRITYCGIFKAPSSPLRPFCIERNTEYLEIVTGGVVYHDSPEYDTFRRGSIFWHQSGDYTIYKTSPEDPYRCLCISLETDGTLRPLPRYGKWGYAPELSSFVENMLYFAGRNRLAEDGVLAYTLGSLLCQMLSNDNSSVPRPVRIACHIMDTSILDDLSVDELARKAGVSRSRLFALFQKHMQCTPYQYLLKRRIAAAKELIIQRPEMPFKHIAEGCGFNNIEIFYRQFCLHTGVTPGEFRKKNTILA